MILLMFTALCKNGGGMVHSTQSAQMTTVQIPQVYRCSRSIIIQATGAVSGAIIVDLLREL